MRVGHESSEIPHTCQLSEHRLSQIPFNRPVQLQDYALSDYPSEVTGMNLTTVYQLRAMVSRSKGSAQSPHYKPSLKVTKPYLHYSKDGLHTVVGEQVCLFSGCSANSWNNQRNVMPCAGECLAHSHDLNAVRRP
jgi:hypothetical protein